MRRVVFDEAAERDLASQIDYLIQNDALKGAAALEARVRSFILDHLAQHPATGTMIGHRGLWETWIPRTRLVLWYRYTDTDLQIVHVWHSSQNRQGASS